MKGWLTIPEQELAADHDPPSQSSDGQTSGSDNLQAKPKCPSAASAQEFAHHKAIDPRKEQQHEPRGDTRPEACLEVY
jgi:hypothetical protein